MNRLRSTLTILAVATLASASPLLAQQPHARVSPHETVSTTVDGDRVTVTYGRPFSKNPKDGSARKIWGELVPFGEVWRTGADEATTLITQKPLIMGDTTIPAGAYSLYTLPKADGTAQLIVNKQLGQWGTDYDEKQDLARIALKAAKPELPVSQFTISINKNATGADLMMSWEDASYSVPLTVKK